MLLIGIEARVSVKTHKQLDLAKTCGDKGGSARKTQQFSIQILIRKYCSWYYTCTHCTHTPFITRLHMWHRSHFSRSYGNLQLDLVLHTWAQHKSSSYATYCHTLIFFQTPKEAKLNHFLLQHPLSGASALNDRKTVYIRTSSNSPLKGVFLGMPIPSWKVGIPAAGSKHRNVRTTRTQGTNGRFPLLFSCWHKALALMDVHRLTVCETLKNGLMDS